SALGRNGRTAQSTLRRVDLHAAPVADSTGNLIDHLCASFPAVHEGRSRTLLSRSLRGTALGACFLAATIAGNSVLAAFESLRHRFLPGRRRAAPCDRVVH